MSNKRPTLVLTPKKGTKVAAKRKTLILTPKKFVDPQHMNPGQIAAVKGKKKIV